MWARVMPSVRCFVNERLKKGLGAQTMSLPMKYFCRVVLLVLVCSVPGICQEKPTGLKDKRITITMEAAPLGTVFRYLMMNYDIPIGFEESDLDMENSGLYFETNPVLKAQSKGSSADGSIKVTVTVKTQRVFEAGTHPIALYIEDGSVEDVFNE